MPEYLICLPRWPRLAQEAWWCHNSCLFVSVLELWVRSQFLEQMQLGLQMQLGYIEGCLSFPSISQMHEREASTGPGIGQNDLVKDILFTFNLGFPCPGSPPVVAEKLPSKFLPLVEIQLPEPLKGREKRGKGRGGERREEQRKFILWLSYTLPSPVPCFLPPPAKSFP